MNSDDLVKALEPTLKALEPTRKAMKGLRLPPALLGDIERMQATSRRLAEQFARIQPTKQRVELTKATVEHAIAAARTDRIAAAMLSELQTAAEMEREMVLLTRENVELTRQNVWTARVGVGVGIGGVVAGILLAVLT